MSRQSMRAVVAALAVLALTYGSALGLGTLDQRQTDGSITTLTWSIAPVAGSHMDLRQTFTVGRTGKLDTVAVDGDDFGHSVTLSVAGSGGVLDKQTLSLSGGWAQVSLTTPPPVTKGEFLTIVLTPSSEINWYGSCDNLYSGGQAYVSDPQTRTVETIPEYGISTGNSIGYCTLDFAFKTYVTTPAVATPTAHPKATAPAPANAATPTATASASPAPSASGPESTGPVPVQSAGATPTPVSTATTGGGGATGGSGGSGDPPSSPLIVAAAVVALAIVALALLFVARRRHGPGSPESNGSD